MIHVAIGVPSTNTWIAEFGECLANMMAYSATAGGGGEDRTLQLINVKSSLLSQSRTRIVSDSLQNDCTHLLFLDSDMTFPPDTLNRLLAHKLPIVACNYLRKEIPAIPVTEALDDSRCHTTKDKSGLEKIKHTGLGVMLIDLSVMKDVPEPWFPVTWHQLKKCYVGEDVYFATMLRKRGVDMWVDHDLSKSVTHVGVFEYPNSLSDIEV